MFEIVVDDSLEGRVLLHNERVNARKEGFARRQNVARDEGTGQWDGALVVLQKRVV